MSACGILRRSGSGRTMLASDIGCVMHPVGEYGFYLTVSRDLQRDAGSRLAWLPMATAPRDGSPFWGKVGDDAIRMLWHDEFKAFVSSWSQMEMQNGWTFEDGSTKRNHSPVTHEPEAWMPMPPAAIEKATKP